MVNDYPEETRGWPLSHPNRATRRRYSKKQPRRIRVRGERLDPPDSVRLSKALIAAQRELEAARVEAQAQQQKGGDDEQGS